ncbi:MAG: hypothetical protein SX243_12280, partial [Acidobacteriota bacterium]|nr:hypothetical protein [Acidobacteriota bacterium]
MVDPRGETSERRLEQWTGRRRAEVGRSRTLLQLIFLKRSLGALLGLAFLCIGPAALAQSSVYCTTSSETGTFIEWLPGSNLPNVNPSCQGAFYCRQATLAGQALEILPTGCDPNSSSCTVRVRVPVTMEGLHQEGLLFAPAQIYWFNNPTPTVPCIPPGLPGASCDPPPISTCGLFGAGIDEDQGEATIQLSNVRCADLDQSRFRQYSFSVYRCKGTSGCETRRDSPTIDLSAASLRSQLGCPEPPKKRCPKDKGAAQCSMCLSAGGGGGGPPGGAGPDGGGGGGGGIGGGGSGWGGGPGGPTGPGARLYYAAGGAGHPGWPGTAEWLPNLGRYWSHDYAQRIVLDPGATPPESHVWLITPWATFREFSNLSGGVYLTNSPSDEYRTLRKVTGGWTLTGLDGTVTTFDTDGRWTSTEDRFGNPKEGFYNVLHQLERVTFADQREELFTYDAGTEKLETITEVGVGGSPTRTWTYTWDGDDLERIDLPDGRAWEFFYEDARFPGYLTRVEVVGTEGGREVDVAWEYDALGNVMALWSGDVSKTGPDAVGLWQLAFDDPANPTVTTVTDPLGAISTYTLGRDDNSRNPRLEELSGSCPACSVGPNSTLAYDDPDHPLLPTRETNARGVHADFTYDEHGQVLTRTEATATALERTTSWTYHPDYPALVTEVEQPSVAGGASVRTTTMVYNAEGALEERRMEGHEEPTGAFSYSTLYTPTQEGLPEVIDPPGFGMGDLTTYVYDAGRGSLVPESRTDPLVGPTTYDYDGYNRRTMVTDPNGVTTIMVYDVGDRVTFVTREGSTPAENLVTENRYDEFGRLFQAILPEGNVIEYGHDAAGRLISIERKPDDQPGSHGERVFYDLDAAGNRTREEHQRWDGTGWVTRSFTDYEWQSRCQMQAVVHADGSRTEHAYDCEGNLSEVWDANHPSMMQTEVPTTLYAYDELDRLDTVTQRWGGVGGGFTTTSYGYDVQDHLTGITDGEGNLTTYVYSD